MEQVAHISNREELSALLPHNQHLPNLFALRLARFTDVCRRVGLPPVTMSPRCAKTILPTGPEGSPLDNLALQDLVWSLRGAIHGLIPCVRTMDREKVAYRIKFWSRNGGGEPKPQHITAVVDSNLAGDERLQLALPDEQTAPPALSSTVLLVENDPDVAEVEQLILEAVEFRVLWAADGLDGLRRAQTEPVAAVVLDADLPGMDGFEICRRLRADVRTRALPIVFLSGSPNAAQRAVEAGADKALSKPHGVAELAACVCGLLNR